MNKKLLRKKLALMLANLKKKRPYYVECEYLEITGTQYIDTGVDIGAEVELEFSFYATAFNGSTYCAPLSARRTHQINSISYAFNNGTTYTSFGNNAEVQISPTITLNTKHVIIQNKEGLWQDDNKTNYAQGYNTNFTETGHLYMFARNNLGSSVGNYFIGRIYYAKIWDNGTLVRDFIPVLDWNMTPCMFDRVTEQLFYNQGTGSFTYGREIHYVDYLESDGTQYIDTGIKPNNNISVEIDYQLTQASQSRAGLFGALNMTGSNQGRFGSILSPSNSYMEHGYGSGNDFWQQGLPDTNRHLLYQKKNEIYFDGTLIHTFNTATFNLVINAYLGSFLYTNYTPAKAKYYGSRWWADNELVRDYKPAIDENGVCFWFDRVSHTIYDNAGTGAFQYPAKETTYTANASTPAYINLGVKYKSSMSIRGKYIRNSAGASGSVIMLSTSASNPLIYLPALSGTTTERFVLRRTGYTEQNYYINNITYPYGNEVELDAVNDTLSLNGTIIKTRMIAGMNGYDSPYESNSNMYMFSITGSYAGNGKVYYLQIDDGNTPVFDLVPAYKDGLAGFYNKIDGTFFSNASTNSSALLTAGKIVESKYE